MKTFRGPLTLLEVDVGGVAIRLEAGSDRADALEAGTPLRLAIAAEACRIIETLSGSGEGDAG